MPELPEVETVRRGLEPVMLKKSIAKVEIRHPHLRQPIPKNFAKGLVGHKTRRLLRRGKYIIAEMDNGEGFVLHLGMSGRIKVQPPGVRGEDGYETHDHVVFTMGDATKIIFNDPRRFGSLVRLGKKWESEKPFSAMGPEPLGNEFNEKTFSAKIAKKNAPIKTVLLDQTVVAGVGNIYACEALFHAGIDPRKKAKALRGQQVAKLVRAVRHVLNLAIEAGGSTLRDHRKTNGEMGYFQHKFSVYDREGKACPGCTCDIAKTGGIQRITQAGRSTFYCPRKQK